MFQEFKRLGRETLIYGLSTVLGRLLNVLLLPVYTNYLAPAEFGVVGTAFAYLAFLNVVYGCGMDLAYMRHAAARPGPEEDRDFSTAFLSVLLSSAVLSGAVAAFAEPLAKLAGLPFGMTSVVRYAALILALDAVALVPFAHLRMRRKAWAFASVKLVNIAVNVGATWWLLARLHQGVPGVFIAAAAASGAALVLLLPLIVAHLRPAFDRELWRALLKFGLPLIPAGLASMVVQVIDRPILQALTDNATVGVYTANYRLGIFMQLLINMFDQAWRPFILPRAKDPQTKALIARMLTYFFAGGCAAVLGVSIFIGDIVRLPVLAGKPLVHPAYWPGLPIVPVVLLGYLFNGVYYNFLAPVNLAKRNDLVAYVTALGAGVNVAANFALIPTFTIMGAALATLAAYAAMAAALYLVAQKVYPVEYEWPRLLHAALMLAVFGLAAFVAAHALAGQAYRIPALFGLWAAFPLSLWATGFLTKGESAALKRLSLAGAAVLFTGCAGMGWPGLPDAHYQWAGDYLKITAVGKPVAGAGSDTQAKATSREAALVEARARLQAYLNKIRVGGRRISYLAEHDAAWGQKVRHVLSEARTVSTDWRSDNSAKVTIAVPREILEELKNP